jgi:hypothetical protein
MKTKRLKKIAILLEHEKQVKNCLERFKEIKGQKLVITSPFAMYELDKHRISYKIIEDYYNSKELYKLGTDNYKKVENLCDIIDEYVQNACPATAKLGIRPALFSFYHLKIIYDAVTIRLFQLSKLIEAEKPNVLYVYDSKRFPFGISRMAPYLHFDNRESIYARLLACEGWGTSVTTLPYVPPPENSDISKSQPSSKALKMRWWLQRHHKLYALATETQKRGWHGLFGGLKSYLGAGGNIRVLIFGRGYDWDYCGAELQSAGIDHFTRIRDDLEYWTSYHPSDTSADALNDAWKGLQVDDKFRKFFVRDNIDFFPVVEERLQFLVEQLTPACINAYKETAELLRKRKIKAFLSSAFDSCTSHSAARAAQNSNVPVVTWQEGSYGYFNHPIAIYNNLMDSDAFFTYGEGVVSEYRISAKRFNTRLLPIGSAALDALSQTRQSRKVKKLANTMSKKGVLYETTNYYQNSLYLSIPPPFSDNHFWYTQRMILDTLAKHHDYTAVVKLHPNPIYRAPSLRVYAETKKFKNCRFFRDEYTATDLLSIADLLVIDFPTTTLLEALTTSKPIFIYIGHLHINTKALKLLERRAFCYRELKSFTNALNEYLSEGKIDRKVNLNDKKFLETYGVGPQKRGSAVRAAKMLKQIISRA